ncbi:hypothetical protein Pcinc_025439 [Petrolisthes cinctipes]|uniref:Uncharacterized protein n=1 Tax=Petrolisthes cinctipes TaxID=88211 RepID=A0AAE1KBL8_PETCI|nr:hypothetical protein Pcinc_025439 [Petrolisthes cinctipes]
MIALVTEKAGHLSITPPAHLFIGLKYGISDNISRRLHTSRLNTQQCGLRGTHPHWPRPYLTHCRHIETDAAPSKMNSGIRAGTHYYQNRRNANTLKEAVDDRVVDEERE